MTQGVVDKGNRDVMVYRSPGEVRAVTSTSYGRIYDSEIADALVNLAGTGAGEMRWKVPGNMDWSRGTYNPNVDITTDTTTLYASDRDLFVFLCDDRNPIEIGKLDNGDPDMLFRGFYVRHSEVGASPLTLATCTSARSARTVTSGVSRGSRPTTCATTRRPRCATSRRCGPSS
jgi:hypothetical protein